jgi:dolichol-phosphate mannosyltransferase
MVSFSNNLLSFSSLFGFIVAGVSLLLGVAYALMKLAGAPFPIGNPTIVILVLFLGGIQLITVGILGEYIGRIYDEVKERPKFIVDTAVGFGAESAVAGR